MWRWHKVADSTCMSGNMPLEMEQRKIEPGSPTRVETVVQWCTVMHIVDQCGTVVHIVDQCVHSVKSWEIVLTETVSCLWIAT